MLSRESEGLSAIGGGSCCDGMGEDIRTGDFLKVADSPMVEASRVSLLVVTTGALPTLATVLGPLEA